MRGDDFYIEAFWALSTTRNFGWVVGPIPVTAMITWAEMHDLDPDMTKVFIKVLRELDEVYIKQSTKQQKQKLNEGDG